MSIDFGALLTTEQKQNLLTQRIQQFAAEGYQHTLNKQVAESKDPVDETLLEQSNNAIATLTAAISEYQAELDKLTVE
jgi:uncharacterized phage infection (PIP) family protein YhgE